MSKGLRLTEKWMQRGLWLVAFVFAGFLIGLGGKVVDNMWRVEPPAPFDSFIDPVRGPAVRTAAAEAEANRLAATERLAQARQRHSVAESNTRTAQQTFENWLSTRRATARPDQDPELIGRTRDLDVLKAAERSALAVVEAQQQALLDATQARDRAAAEWSRLAEPAREAAYRAGKAQELRVFLYRLAMTLPLLLAAAWLFAKKRHGQYWPFVWGFIFFALFAFFVELVPYLPSYGGYVRYGVGIVLTAVIGRYAIVSLQRYLERQKASEALPEVKRRETLRYDSAMARLEKGVCPGCERAVDLKDAKLDFCPHCGIGLFDRCGHCTARKSAFARFCFACGTAANVSLTD
ncbi:MAG: serine endopeptidase [Massilia sp.]|nr:serine endopeptidase [Massilia sp.]